MSNDERYLTKGELATVLGVSPEVVQKWNGVIPSQWFHRYPGAGVGYYYAPIAVAFGELLIELGQLLGGTSRLPRLLAQQAVPSIEAAWRSPTEARTLALCHEHVALLLPLSCVARAKHKLQALKAGAAA